MKKTRTLNQLNATVLNSAQLNQVSGGTDSDFRAGVSQSYSYPASNTPNQGSKPDPDPTILGRPSWVDAALLAGFQPEL